MKKTTKSVAEPVKWDVYMASSKRIWPGRLTYLGSVEARDEQEAIDKAMRELNIREADRFRISVRRE
jgi:hypothetical protein